MKRHLALALLALCPVLAMSQQKPPVQEEDPMVRTRQAIDKAMAQAQSMQSGAAQAGPKTGFSVDELRKMKGVDPSDLAAKYQNAGVGQKPATQDLMIFISTSVPKKALVMLGEQANATGAVLVLRGLKGALGTKGVMQKTMEALQPVAATGAKIQIDPEAFGRYNVTAVPTFVIATKEDTCANEQCDTKSYAMAGDVTLEYALEQWSSRGGPIGRQADMYLKRLERGQ